MSAMKAPARTLLLGRRQGTSAAPAARASERAVEGAPERGASPDTERSKNASAPEVQA
ncbi:MAG: hypothetical protein R3F14_33115 [Polyangiaceae bacterium]